MILYEEIAYRIKIIIHIKYNKTYFVIQECYNLQVHINYNAEM